MKIKGIKISCLRKLPGQFFLSILLFSVAFSQSIDDKVSILGLYNDGHSQYLVTEKGLLDVDINKAYEKYYQMIYQDTTITNPNTIINSNRNLNIPFIHFEIDKKYFRKFDRKYSLSSYVSIDSTGKVIILPAVNKLLEKYSEK